MFATTTLRARTSFPANEVHEHVVVRSVHNERLQ